jgi:hypothetical protein
MLHLLLFVFFPPPPSSSSSSSPQYPNPLSRSLIQEHQNLQIKASFNAMTRFFSLREDQSRFSPK